MSQIDLAECVRLMSVSATKLMELNVRVATILETLESYLTLHRIQRVAHVKLDDGCELAWSQAKNRGPWRFVIRDEDVITELLSTTPEEQADVFTSGAMRRLLVRLVVLR